MDSRKRRLELGVVFLFVCAMVGLQLNKAYHIDEPWFLALARHILRDPLHPGAFEINWFGRTVPLSQINNHPPYLSYLLAPGLWLTGGGEWRMRLLFAPFDLLAAGSLYLLAGRFLKRPLWPTLIVLATPAYFINMPHLMCEKFIAALGFAGIYCLVKAIEEDRPRLFWASALCVAGAMVVKPSALFFVLLAAGYGLLHRQPVSRIIGYLTLSMAPVLIFFGSAAMLHPNSHGSLPNIIQYVMIGRGTGLIHRFRSTLAFIGGCAVVTALWPWLVFKDKKREIFWSLGAIAFTCILFLPVFDEQAVVPLDRFLGILFSAGALRCFVGVCQERFRQVRGWQLWSLWALSVAGLQIGVYWAIVARYILFMLPSLIFLMAGALENIFKEESAGGRNRGALAAFWERREGRFYATSFAITLAVSLCLAEVDKRYAAGQKEMADYAAEHYISAGKRVWFTGHWGLQYYMERAGAFTIDRAQGAWDAVRPGDVIVMPVVNSGIIGSPQPVRGHAYRLTLRYPVPLRLMMMGDRQAGFYSSGDGFLPFTWSSTPLDEFLVVEAL